MSPTPTGGSLLDTAVERFHDLVLADPRLAALADVGVEDGHLDDVREVVAGLRDQVVEA
ncbi:hypothetical protein SAMN05660199_00191 [Klenkia soli]|uniref:Uncharacterized protein n=1 Tax=Klenkia soli TaxID=1052260 RepID=A0A1H0C2Z4_9ACTN|nr:hypothetical protein [Klenkia soli]SDN52224.1 hypothetical protein SAMN05660199_00191 [Klenkia soli]